MPDYRDPQAVGGVVPELTLPDLHGTQRGLAAALDGKRGAVVVFWSGVCSHCVRYDDYLNDFEARHPEVALVVVASREGEDGERLRSTAAERKLRFRILRDAERGVAHAWLVKQTPRVFLIDADRRLRYRGAIDNFKYPDDTEHEPYLESAIGCLLRGQEVARTETPSFGCPIESVYYTMPKPLG